MKNNAIFILVMLVVWVGICTFASSELYNNETVIELIPVAQADTNDIPAETTEPAPCFWHTWSDWSVVKIDNKTGPGCKFRTCEVCGQEQSRSFMEHPNAISIPKLFINTTFASSDEYHLLNSDFVYYTPDAKHPTIMTTVDISSLKDGDSIYINTEFGLSLYMVRISEPATLDAEGNLVGNHTKRNLWQHEFERSLHLYSLDGDTGWIVVADYLGIPK